MIDRFAAKASRRHTLRALVLVGSALGSTVGIAQSASAQNQTVGSTPYQNTGTLSGGPTTVTATAASGDINLDLNTVVAANNGSGTSAPSGAAISATNTGTGAITIKDVNATITGSGASNGIIATAQTGAINITQTGVVDATNATNGRGIAAVTNGGTITINAAEADGGRRGVYTGFTNNPGSLVTINVGTATATGDGSVGLVNAIIGQGSQVVVNSGTASVTNAAASQGTAIFVNADTGGAQVTAGTTNAYGQNQAALQVFSNGAVNVASSAVNTTQNSDGISIASGTDIVVNSGTITAQGGNGGGARGIVVGGNAGGGGFNSGPNGFAYNSAAITSGTITTGGVISYGIFVTPNGPGTTTITSGAITTTGTGAYGIYETAIGSGAITGASTINSTGALTTGNAEGIRVNAGTGAVTINNTGTVRAGGDQNNAIDVIGTTGAVNVVGAGTTSASGNNAHAINVQTGTGAIVVNSGTATTSGQGAAAIQSYTTSGSTTIVSTSVQTAGASAAGIYGSTTTGALAITSGTATTTGASSSGIFATSSGGTVSVTSGDVTNTGRLGTAIEAQQTSGTGALTVNSTGSITTSGNGAEGIVAYASGAITIAANSISMSGSNSAAIVASPVDNSSSPISVTAGTIRTTGASSGGIYVFDSDGATGPVTVSLANSTTTGGAVDARSNAAVAVTAGTVRVAGGTSTGLSAISNAAGVTVTSTDLGVANGRGIFASGATGASVTSNTLAATGTGSDFGLIAQVSTPAQGSTLVPTGVTVNSTTLTSTAGGIRTSSLAGDTTIKSGAVTISGTNLAGIYAVSTTGNINLTSGTLNASGQSGNGIYAQAGTGNVVVNSTSATTTGAYLASTGNTPDAIVALNSTNGTGTITINSGTATAAGDGASAVFASGGGNVSVTSGTAGTTGNSPYTGSIVALGANSSKGDVVVNAGTTTATGTNSLAVSARATTGNATVNSGTASAVNGFGLSVLAGKVATVTATTVAGGGDGFGGVTVTGGTGVVLNIGSASSTGALTTTTINGTTTTNRADAIYAVATNGTINATIGSATATGQGADAVHLIASGTGGGVTTAITGALSSTSGYGLYIDPPGANMVTVASGASISGATGVSLTGATNSLVNAGTITGTAGPGIVASGQTTLDNAGAIAGSGGTAVQLGATDDSVILRTGSAVTGAIAGGGGIDSATLIGSSATATSGQQVAAFTGFDNVTVQSGYWTASAPSSFATSATIATGASLAVANGASGLALTAPSIVDNGALVVTGSSASAGSTFGASVVTGSGTVTLAGGQVTLDGTNSLQNTGGTTVAAGTNVLITGTQGGTFVNNGTVQVGNGGTAGNFTGTLADNGTLISNRSDNYTFAGALTGGGTFVQNGSGTVTFGNNYAFTGATVLNGGAIKLSTPVAPTTQFNLNGTGTYDLSGVNQTIAALSGTSPSATINIAGDALTVNQATNTSFAGTITGNGSLTKTGSGSLNLTGTNTYTGPTTVNGGRLAVNGSIASPVTVNAGAVLGGNGTLPSATIASGGTLAPGNSIGTINVPGNVTFAAGSTYQVEANAAGMADRINAGTVTINGGTVQVLAAPGTYNPITQYTVITATGGITGQFAGVTSSLAFLSPLLTYSANAVTLGLFRNDINFAAMASSPSGVAVANAIASLGFGNRLYNAILIQTATGAPVAFNQLSGEIHATIPSVLIDSDRRVRDAVMDHNRAGLHDGLELWIQSLGTTAHSRDQGANANFNTTRMGVVGGADYGIDSFRIGINGGYFDGRLRDPNVYSRAQIDTGILGGSIAWLPAEGRLTAQAGITHAWHHIDTTRSVTVPGLAGAYIANAKATTTQAFGEVAFALIDGPLAVTPFVRYAHDWERADGFTELGGVAALTVARDRRSNDFGSAGVRLSGLRPISDGLAIEPNLSVGYLHSWGQLYSVRSEAIGGAAFSVTGNRLGRDNLDANGGLNLVVKDQLRLGVSGYLTRSSQWRDYGGKASVSFRF